MLKRWKITIEYMGGGYHGWQKQDGLRTIQESVERAVHKFCQQDISITGAGRTDAGVHAWAQIAHFDLDYGSRPLEGFELAKALNAHLLNDTIIIRDAEVVADDFHARFSAHNKLYTYRIICNRRARPVMDLGKAWHFKHALDVKSMYEAAQHLIGHHDFSTFRDSNCQANSPMKTIERIDIKERRYDDFGGQELLIEVEGKSFLHHQVRNIAGTLSLVGEGKWKAVDVKHALESKDRTEGGPTAPADGLYMTRIDY